MRKIILIVSIVAVAVVGAGFMTSADDDKEIVVEIGSSASSAEKADHTLTLKALERGKGSFKVTTASGSYEFSLNEKQIKDLLGGTTVMAKAASGQDMAVKVSLVDTKKKKKKGW